MANYEDDDVSKVEQALRLDEARARHERTQKEFMNDPAGPGRLEGGNLSDFKVTTLNPKREPTIRDEVLTMLHALTADIESGKVTPSHLIMGWGEKMEIEGKPATGFIWDAAGLNTFEVVGHLNSYATRLTMGEGE